MSRTATFKCPSCGGYLEFDPEGQRFLCPYCEASFNEAELREQSEAKMEEAEVLPKEELSADGGLRSYHCQMCGAEVVTGDTTAATRCYYCHNPIVLSDRLTDEFRPDGVIPFRLSKEQAEQAFKEYIGSKKFIDEAFFSPQQLEDFSGVYYPVWYSDVAGEVSFSGQGTKVHTAVHGNERVTTTRIFQVTREAVIRCGNLVRQALSSNNRKIADGIHPYDMSEVKPFAMGYLSGFLAEKRDVEADAIRGDVEAEVQRYAQSAISRNGEYHSLSGNTGFRVTDRRERYVLLPTWVLTYKAREGGAPYYYMMNGQTGAVCGRLPLKKSKLLMWCAIVGGAVAAALCLGGAMLW